MSTSTNGRVGHLGFIHLVPFDRDDPARGLAEGIELFRFAEELGLDSGWVRTRHMQYGLPSPAVYFAALAQHTQRIGIGSAVIPVGHENPYRLAEDLAVADVLSGGRVLPGLSVHPRPLSPMRSTTSFMVMDGAVRSSATRGSSVCVISSRAPRCGRSRNTRASAGISTPNGWNRTRPD